MSFPSSIRGLVTWFMDPRSTILDLEGPHRVEAFAHHITECYRQIESIETENTNLPQCDVMSRFFDVNEYMRCDSAYRAPVKKLFELANDHLADYISHLFLLGSLATLDYKKGWSDLDAFMIVKKETLLDSEQLVTLRSLCLDAWKFFLEITPLQHHGFITVTQYDLVSYQSHYMPPKVFETAYSLLNGREELSLLLDSNDTGSLQGLKSRLSFLEDALHTGEFRHHPKNRVYLQEGYKNANDNMYQLFCLLGYVMTVPSYYLDAVGLGCSKTDSFHLARQNFSNTSWSFISRCSEIRSEWETREGTRFQGNQIPSWVQHTLGPNYIADSFHLVKEAIERIECK